MTLTQRADAGEDRAGSVRLEQDGSGVATVWIDNPQRKNAITPAMCRSLLRILREIDGDSTVRVVVLRGAGGHFSAGASIDDVENVLYQGRSEQSPAGEDLLSAVDEAITAVRCPVIAAVEGICMGGAWQVAASADLVLASTTARLAITPAKLGIVYPRRGLERLVRHVGADRAKYILFVAEEIDIRIAEEWGMVTAVVAAEDFETEVSRLARVMLSRSQYSAVQHKALIDAYSSAGLTQEGYESGWARAWEGVLSSGDLEEGRQAFLAKRSPEFGWSRPKDH